MSEAAAVDVSAAGTMLRIVCYRTACSEDSAKALLKAIPLRWERKLWYVSANKQLVFLGHFREEDYEALTAILSAARVADEATQALARLRDCARATEQTSSLRRRFAKAVRWSYLVLIALILEKSFDGVWSRVAGASSPGQCPQCSMNVKCSNCWIPWILYALGWCQVLATLLLVGRYLVCAVDPLWRCDKATMQTRRCVWVSTIVLAEFGLLYHAAVAVPQAGQWLQLLWWLPIVDMLIILSPMTYFAMLEIVSGKPAQTDASSQQPAGASCLRPVKGAFAKVWKKHSHVLKYWIWDSIDLVVISVFLCLYRHFSDSPNYYELALILVFMLVTACVSVLNVWFLAETYNGCIETLS
ncbi:hypothetical protein RAS1_42450 [Phycisphaerae bacterium RAS1]|nr:hypothetical protein RAS1_42450 [Phycisphaerae bacterium RAS1]